MGVLNLTPDSFSDGGRHANPQMALEHMQLLLQEGADIIDIGAESTFGPEAEVSAEQEWQRLSPVLEQIDYNKVFVSVDTWKSEVAEKALQCGVQMINDVTALRGDSQLIEVLLKYEPYVCLMYSADKTAYATRTEHHYDDVMGTVIEFLERQVHLLIEAGFPQDKIIVDPGLGFFLSSDPRVSWEVIERLEELKSMGYPMLIAPSMKSFLGGEISERQQKSVQAALQCYKNGANIVRMHHVKALDDHLTRADMR